MSPESMRDLTRVAKAIKMFEDLGSFTYTRPTFDESNVYTPVTLLMKITKVHRNAKGEC